MIYKEQNLNAADNQTQNLTGNPHNPNLTNTGSGKFLRDYDKEPIILKNYEEAYQVLLKMVQLTIGLYGAGALNSFDDYTDIIDALISCIPVFYQY